MKKKILITEVNSYVANKFTESLVNDFDIFKISIRDGDLKDLDFSK